MNLNIINQHLEHVEKIINDETPVKSPKYWRAGIDLGTADIVLIVIDEDGKPIAAFLEWAEVVRDGIVLDYWGATQIVQRLVQKAEKKVNIKISGAVTSYPPGTDPRISKNVIEAAGLQVEGIIDEPSSVIKLLGIENGAVIDIGGGTTGISVIRNQKISYTADEPTGGRHLTLTIAGNQKISYEEAEEMKINNPPETILPIVQAVFEKMADIVNNHLGANKIKDLYLSGGTCCFAGIESIFKNELNGREIIVPYNPLFLTPLAIASYKTELNSSNE